MTYFGQRGAPGPSSKTGSPMEEAESHSGPSITRQPTAFERFVSLGKARKDWEVEWPPSHWTDGEARSASPGECSV